MTGYILAVAVLLIWMAVGIPIAMNAVGGGDGLKKNVQYILAFVFWPLIAVINVVLWLKNRGK